MTEEKDEEVFIAQQDQRIQAEMTLMSILPVLFGGVSGRKNATHRAEQNFRR